MVIPCKKFALQKPTFNGFKELENLNLNLNFICLTSFYINTKSKIARGHKESKQMGMYHLNDINFSLLFHLKMGEVGFMECMEICWYYFWQVLRKLLVLYCFLYKVQHILVWCIRHEWCLFAVWYRSKKWIMFHFKIYTYIILFA